MSKATKPTDEAALDVKLMKALGHPLRQRILQVLDRDVEASPKQIAETIDEPLANVGYHVRFLAKLDAIEQVRVEPGEKSMEHFYRAKVRPVLDEESWSRIPEHVRASLLGQTFQQIWQNSARGVSEGGGMDDLRTAAAWSAFRLTDDAFAELSRMVEDLMDKAKALEKGSEIQLEALDDPEREAQTRLVELDLMLYPILEDPTP